MVARHVEAAASPGALSLRGWGEVLARAGKSWLHNRRPAAAAGAAFYLVLAFFPGVAAFGAALGLLGQPEGVERKLAALSDFVPADVFHVIAGEAPRFARGAHAGLAWTAPGWSTAGLPGRSPAPVRRCAS